MIQFLASGGQNNWSFSFIISPSSEFSGLIFKMDWLDLLAIQGTLKSLMQHNSSKAATLRCSAFFIVMELLSESESEVAQLCQTLSDPIHGLQPPRLLYPWDFPGKSTGAAYEVFICDGPFCAPWWF